MMISILSPYQFHSISVTLFWFVIDEVFYHYCASPVVHLISLVKLPIGFSIFFSTDSVNIQSKYAKFNEFPSKGLIITCGAACSLASVQKKSAMFPFSEPYDDNEVVIFLFLL